MTERDQHGGSSSRRRRSLYHNLGGGHLFVGLETIPMLYELYEEELNYAASRSGMKMRKLFDNFNSKVINKIPKANDKTKRRM
ncbi:unnamed protein product [Eruca vesicaria subsp. sativa]|uniref:Uncharacterized protein n=1 Tax=Eruca vesicaria subsp. sativa TaxID=29727 RepID=A0ABC8KSK1_ERUVS|nr:unnamed protein product [Eruca vesicaria subsp. sativa]